MDFYKKNKAILLPIIISVGTYFVDRFFYLGYFRFFSIPMDLFEVNYNNIFISLIAVALFLFSSYFIIKGFFIIEKAISSESVLSKIIKNILFHPILIIGYIISTIEVFLGKMSISLAITGLSLLALLIILGAFQKAVLRKDKQVNLYTSFVKELSQDKEKEDDGKSSLDRLQISSAIIIFFFIISGVLSFFGELKAKMDAQNPSKLFPFLAINNECFIIIDAQNSYFITKKFKKYKQIEQLETHLINRKNGKDFLITEKKLSEVRSCKDLSINTESKIFNKIIIKPNF